jgi:hypothetical protein
MDQSLSGALAPTRTKPAQYQGARMSGELATRKRFASSSARSGSPVRSSARWNCTVSVRVAWSSTSQNEAITVGTPARKKLHARLREPSPVLLGPRAVAHAARTAMRALERQVLDFVGG